MSEKLGLSCSKSFKTSQRFSLLHKDQIHRQAKCLLQHEPDPRPLGQINMIGGSHQKIQISAPRAIIRHRSENLNQRITSQPLPDGLQNDLGLDPRKSHGSKYASRVLRVKPLVSAMRQPRHLP